MKRQPTIPAIALIIASALAAFSMQASAQPSWVVVADCKENLQYPSFSCAGYQFMRASSDQQTRSNANDKVEVLRDEGYTGVHAVPTRAFDAQVAAGVMHPDFACWFVNPECGGGNTED